MVTQAGGGCRVVQPHRRGVNHQPREARGMRDPGSFSAHSLHLLQPRAQGLVREMPLTEEPLAPFGPGGPCGEGQGVSGVGPFPPGPGCDPHPRSPASLLPSSSALGTSRSLSLYLLHREADGGVFTHTEVGGPVGPSPAPHPPRQGNRSSGGPSEKQQGRAGLGGPDVEPPAPPDSLPQGQRQRSWGRLGPRGPRLGWSSEVGWFWVSSNSRLRDVSWVSQLQGEAPGWCLEAGTPPPHVRARPALLVQTARGQEGPAAVLTVPKTPTEDCPHALKCLGREAHPQLPHLKSVPSDPLPDFHRS